MQQIKTIQGTGIIVIGDEIDTDRIIPARFLKSIVFSGLEKSVFIDDRSAIKKNGSIHPFDDERFQKANILLVNKNFGCGSSREHAAQAIHRWGIKAIVGESFSEIFLSNCTAIGLPCFSLSEQEIDSISKTVNHQPKEKITIDLLAKSLTIKNEKFNLNIDSGINESFINGEWNTTQILLKSKKEIEKKNRELDYLQW